MDRVYREDPKWYFKYISHLLVFHDWFYWSCLYDVFNVACVMLQGTSIFSFKRSSSLDIMISIHYNPTCRLRFSLGLVLLRPKINAHFGLVL